jgi:hypothetical protein
MTQGSPRVRVCVFGWWVRRRCFAESGGTRDSRHGLTLAIPAKETAPLWALIEAVFASCWGGPGNFPQRFEARSNNEPIPAPPRQTDTGGLQYPGLDRRR